MRMQRRKFADAGSADALGYAMAVGNDGLEPTSARLLVVGAPGANAATAFFCDENGCSVASTLPAPPGTPSSSRFGSSIAASPDGTMVAVGAPAAGPGGSAFVFSCAPRSSSGGPTCSAPLYAQDGVSGGPLPPLSRFGTAVALSDSVLVASAPGFLSGGGIIMVGPSPATLPLGVLQYASYIGVQQVISPRDPGLPGAPWAASPLQPPVPFLVASSNATENYPNLAPLYRCRRAANASTNVSVGAWGFGTSPGCSVDVTWDAADVIGYASTVPQAPFTSPLWLCQTVGYSPGLPTYFGWVPGYGACASSSVAAILAYVAVPMAA